jgi:hypothetical protein
MQLAGEMDAFDGHVGGEDELVTAAWLKQRRVVANAKAQARVTPLGERLEPADELAFG